MSRQLGYTYLTEKKKSKELRKALAELDDIDDWHIIVAKTFNTDASKDEIPYLAEEYALYIDDIDREMDGASATVLRGYLDKVNVILAAAKGEYKGLGFFKLSEASHGVVITALAMAFIFGPIIGFTFFKEIGIFSKD